VIRAGVRVPQDLSIIGHDNQPIAAYCPIPLTSMTQPVEQIAEATVDLLNDRLGDENGQVIHVHPARTVTFQGQLVLRNSVSSPQK
jgi:DNA-binding LacI/PurR family transcriptional regulator